MATKSRRAFETPRQRLSESAASAPFGSMVGWRTPTGRMYGVVVGKEEGKRGKDLLCLTVYDKALQKDPGLRLYRDEDRSNRLEPVMPGIRMDLQRVPASRATRHGRLAGPALRPYIQAAAHLQLEGHAEESKFWIQGAVKRPGRLRKILGVSDAEWEKLSKSQKLKIIDQALKDEPDASARGALALGRRFIGGEFRREDIQRIADALSRLRKELSDADGSIHTEGDDLEENSRAVLHWVRQKFGAAKAKAHRAFVKMVRRNPSAHRRKMRTDRMYHQRHKWHDALMRKTKRSGWVRRHIRPHLESYDAYCDFGCHAFTRYCEAHPDIDSEDFGRYVTAHNRADRDSGELEDIAPDEIARLGREFAKANGLEERDPGQAFMDLPFELRVTEGGSRSSMKVQTLIFSKDRFSRKDAMKWAKAHGFKAAKVDEKENTFRLRQRDPDQFGTFRTITFKPGIKAVVARS